VVGVELLVLCGCLWLCGGCEAEAVRHRCALALSAVAGLLHMAQIGLGLASGLLRPLQLGECDGSIYRAACRVWLVMVVWQRLCGIGVRVGAGLVYVRLNMA
jgi:hypothetical protein